MESQLEDMIESIDREPLQNPFVKIVQKDSTLTIPLQVKKIAEFIDDPSKPKMDRYEGIYNWMHENIQYDEALRQKTSRNKLTPDNWPNIINILKNRGGICCNMGQLYIAMAKSVGLEAKYARIIIDCNNKRVNHACATIGKKPDGNMHYVDPAYNSFDVAHYYAKIKDDVGTDQRIMESMLRKPWKQYEAACRKRDWETLVVLGERLLKFDPLETYTLKANIGKAFYSMGLDLYRAGYKDVAKRSWKLALEFQPNNTKAKHNLDMLNFGNERQIWQLQEQPFYAHGTNALSQ